SPPCKCELTVWRAYFWKTGKYQVTANRLDSNIERGNNINTNRPIVIPPKPAASAAFNTIRANTPRFTASFMKEGLGFIAALQKGGTTMAANRRIKRPPFHTA